MVAGLLRRQFADRWQDTEGITSQHDNVGWLTIDYTGNLGVGDIVDGIRTARVLRDTNIVVIRHTRYRVVHDVLKDRAEFNSAKNFGLLLARKVDALGVTSTFNIEHAGVGPDVFIITDEETLGVSGECGFARSGKTEEECDITVLHTDVGRRVEGKLAEFDGLEVVL